MSNKNFFDDWFIQESLPKNQVDNIIKEIDDIIVRNNVENNIHLTSSTGNISQYNLNEVIGQTSVIDELSNIVSNSLRKNGYLTKIEEIRRVHCWTAIGENGAYHTVHSHNNQIMKAIVCVFYLQVPNKNQEDIHDRSGNFFMFSRRNELMEFSPKQGDYLVFPTWIYHGTYPQSEGTRQTLNIDYVILT